MSKIAGYIQKQYGFHWKLLLAIVLMTTSSFSLSDSQRIVEYEYDGAGNIVGIRASRNLGSPDVTSISPAFVNRDILASITATGVNLYKASVTTNTPGLSVVNTTNVSETEVRFTLAVDKMATIETGLVSFTTRLGSDTENIIIADRTPIISTVPNPILLLPNTPNVTVKLIFDEPFATDQIYDVLIQDTAVASITVQTITLIY